MLDSIIGFSIRNKLIVILFTLGLLGWGGYELTHLPIDAVPDITNNQVQVFTRAPSLSATDIERLISFPVEQSLAGIPHVQELRSLSRFGLSVVTIVFHDDVDIYWARSQVDQRLSEARKNIPAQLGSPEMGPVSTGLGEIYQYTLKPLKGFENQYDAYQLRTIQDWYIRRQLLGTPGVAEVNSIGGYLKQFEVAIDPVRLRSFGLTLHDVFTALETNNQNAGGAYIEKNSQSFFIRSEGLLENFQDIENVVIRQMENGLPILIRDVAKVQLGHAVRYGALTRNHEPNAVGGIVMMLKGENSNEVAERVKARMAEIAKTLPQGIAIEPYLDRTELVDRAIGTVSKNLIEGALIVIFVLVLFLGNIRAGLLVASVIPLSMLFAVICMNLFGISGNLMSLGAIDFGLIVDGAVIIVEATLHHLGLSPLKRRNQSEMDAEVFESARKIRTAAAFGELVILIVYLPILALSGIEGKMFKPMAQTVGFAIAGAFILSLTYVPMMSALILQKQVNSNNTLIDKMMHRLQNVYRNWLGHVLSRAGWVVSAGLALFLGSILVFRQLGGEFIPNLDEGDFALEVRLMAGSSLSETVNQTCRAANILMHSFPEVKEVVGKIGSPEIPTDPMPAEACDLMVVLKPKDEWTSAETKEELAEKISTSLKVIPGFNFSIQQPIQMRFNELISGIKQDVGVKIYGEDLQELSRIAEQVNGLVAKVKGAEEIVAEQITGLAQIVVSLNRPQMAHFGVQVTDVNEALSMAFAGQQAGVVYEGEKRFDLVVRLDTANRTSIQDVENLFITAKNGMQIPLNQVAMVEMKDGPNQIQKDNTRRRVVVGFNVRGRDVESVVAELQARIASEIKLPPGYHIAYGGQFENLQEANRRLAIVVPIALVLILVLLYFSFGNISHSLLIFSSIPLASIGGVLALWSRSMPFSISAGVGFIALFGVAVLNGIVLIAALNRLKTESTLDLKSLILEGASIRLRPILMTATVASLGFLPMAVATSAGAEVQKPLATVVMGGLITCTLLSLFVLPCLYWLIEKRSFRMAPGAVALVFLLGLGMKANAQELSLNQLIEKAKSQNKLLLSGTREVEAAEAMKRTAVELPKTDFSLMLGQYNSYIGYDNNVAVSQAMPWPGVFKRKSSLLESQASNAKSRRAISENELVFQIKSIHNQWLALVAEEEVLANLDSVFIELARIADRRLERGEGHLLEKTSAAIHQKENLNLLKSNRIDRQILLQSLTTLTGETQLVQLKRQPLMQILPEGARDVSRNPQLVSLRHQTELMEFQKQLTSRLLLPDWKVGVFSQTLVGNPRSADPSDLATGKNRFYGVQFGLSVPVLTGPYRAKVKAEAKQKESADLLAQHTEIKIKSELEQAYLQMEKLSQLLDYYRKDALVNAELILSHSRLAHQNGEVPLKDVLIHIQQAEQVQMDYIKTLAALNQTSFHISFLLGNY